MGQDQRQEVFQRLGLRKKCYRACLHRTQLPSQTLMLFGKIGMLLPPKYSLCFFCSLLAGLELIQ